MKRYLSALVASALLILSAAPAEAAGGAANGAGGKPPAQEDSAAASLTTTGRRVRIVAKSGLYGFGGGLVVGLASQVFKKNTKNIFLFGSLGLYSGLILGLYVITTSSGPQPYEGPDTYDDFSWNHSAAPLELARNETRASRQETKMNLLDLKF